MMKISENGIFLINFNRFNKEPIYNSIWDVFDEYENILKEQDKKRYAKGELISDRETFATFFNGEYAICSYYISRKREQGSSTKTHCLSYYMINIPRQLPPTTTLIITHTISTSVPLQRVNW